MPREQSLILLDGKEESRIASFICQSFAPEAINREKFTQQGEYNFGSRSPEVNEPTAKK
ncbi:MAG: hypothetical protein ACW97Z_12140 [Candidatus Hodarchaeales archaeon]|jgi:hypothetical protein